MLTTIVCAGCGQAAASDVESDNANSTHASATIDPEKQWGIDLMEGRFDPNPNAPKPTDDPTFSSQPPDTWETELKPDWGEAPVSLSVFVSSGYWMGIVSGRRIIVYAGEDGTAYYGNEPETGTGKVWWIERDEHGLAIGDHWTEFPGTGQLKYINVEGSTAILAAENGSTIGVNLAEMVAQAE